MPVSLRDDLERRLTEMPGLIRRPSSRGHGHTYFAGGREIAHFHGDERLDVRLTRDVIGQRKVHRAFDDRVKTRGPSADWVAVRVVEARDVPLALALVGDAVRINSREHGTPVS
jgi:hypothetical protein